MPVVRSNLSGVSVKAQPRVDPPPCQGRPQRLQRLRVLRLPGYVVQGLGSAWIVQLLRRPRSGKVLAWAGVSLPAACSRSMPSGVVRSPAFQAMLRLHAAGKLTPAQADCFTTPRPAEELYDLRADPQALHNVAGRRSTRSRWRRCGRPWHGGGSTRPTFRP